MASITKDLTGAPKLRFRPIICCYTSAAFQNCLPPPRSAPFSVENFRFSHPRDEGAALFVPFYDVREKGRASQCDRSHLGHPRLLHVFSPTPDRRGEGCQLISWTDTVNPKGIIRAKKGRPTRATVPRQLYGNEGKKVFLPGVHVFVAYCTCACSTVRAFVKYLAFDAKRSSACVELTEPMNLA